MFPEIFLVDNFKHDTLGKMYKLLGKCSFNYFDEYFINLT